MNLLDIEEFTLFIQKRDMLSISRLKQNIDDINTRTLFAQQENAELRQQLKGEGSSSKF